MTCGVDVFAPVKMLGCFCDAFLLNLIFHHFYFHLISQLSSTCDDVHFHLHVVTFGGCVHCHLNVKVTCGVDVFAPVKMHGGFCDFFQMNLNLHHFYFHQLAQRNLICDDFRLHLHVVTFGGCDVN